MATANPRPAGPPRRGTRIWLVAAAILAVLVALFWRPVAGYAQVGAAYGARVGCSCRYVAGRSLADCEKDFEPGMELVSLSEDAKAKSVTARFALVHAETATWREGEGCRLDAWKD